MNFQIMFLRKAFRACIIRAYKRTLASMCPVIENEFRFELVRPFNSQFNYINNTVYELWAVLDFWRFYGTRSTFVELLLVALGRVSFVPLATSFYTDFDIFLQLLIIYRHFHRWHFWNTDLVRYSFHCLLFRRILYPKFLNMIGVSGPNFHIVA